MKILIAPDSFKGSLSASKVAGAMGKGVKKVLPRVQLVKMPLSDGGEGLVDSLIATTGGEIIEAEVTGPLGKTVSSFWGLMGDGETAVIEMAAASGLPLVPKGRCNPTLTTTYGTGELIKAALDRGCSKLIIGIGGSATNDGGSGMAQALGISLTDATGKEIPFGGGNLAALHKIDITGLDPRLRNVPVLVACDVDNSLTGPQGASYIYSPQKGATPEMAAKLEQALIHYSRILRHQLGADVEKVPGAGAAGGLGAGLMAFLGAKLTPGIELVMESTGLAKELKGCSLVLTGEGKLDIQSTYGKVPVGVARIAQKENIPVVVLAGALDEELEAIHQEGVTACFSIVNGPISLETAMQNAAALVEATTAEIIRLWIGQKRQSKV